MTRQLISFYTKYYGMLTHVEVARELGYKDHTTTISGARKIKDLLDSGNGDVVTATQKINHKLKITA
jgi:chromosomal replication initiation ATPase DnaA